MSIGDYYNKRVSIQRSTLTWSDTAAAGTEVTEDVYQDVQCAIQPLSARELDLFGKTTAEVTHRAFFDSGTDIKARDRVVEGNPIETLLGIGSTEYLVDGVTDAAGRSHHMEVLLLERVTEEVDGG